MKQFSVVGMDHRSEKRVGRLMKKMFVLWRRIVETKNPVIIKKKTTSTSKNKTKMTTKNNKYSPAHSLSKDHQAKTITLLRLFKLF